MVFLVNDCLGDLRIRGIGHAISRSAGHARKHRMGRSLANGPRSRLASDQTLAMGLGRPNVLKSREGTMVFTRGYEIRVCDNWSLPALPEPAGTAGHR